MAQTKAQSAAMAKAAADFDAANQSLTAMLKKLMHRLSMLQTSWKGLAAGEFEKVKAQYAADLAQLNKALAETADAIRTSGASYDTTDTNAASRVRKSGGGGLSLPL